jgi:hypothetical protein
MYTVTYWFLTQSKELTRGTPELGGGGRSHRRKSAACSKFYMVWLNRLPIPVGRTGVNFLVQMIFSCVEEGGGGRHPVVLTFRLGLVKKIRFSMFVKHVGICEISFPL